MRNGENDDTEAWGDYLQRTILSVFQLSADDLAACGDVNASYALSAKQQQQRAWRALQPRLAAAEHALSTATSTTDPDNPTSSHEA